MKVVIAGFDVEGRASLEYWRGLGHDVAIADQATDIKNAPAGVRTILGPEAFEQLDEFDLIVRTPGAKPSKFNYGDKVWSATNEFLAMCPAPVIGVTGSKGKGTTCSLITSVLSSLGRTVHLVGNIGVPALSVLPSIRAEDIVVYELSSFQLWDAHISPHIAVVLPIEPDHLDVHDSMEQYVEAKANIRRFQTELDSCIYHPTDNYAHQVAASTNLGQAVRYGVPYDGQVYVRDGWFMAGDDQITEISHLKLPGQHNIENACAALSAVLATGAELDSAATTQGLESFGGLPHRLKLVAERGGVRYYDDSIATTPGSAIAAIRSFDGPKVLILGGHDKGADYYELLHICRETGTRVVAIGELGERLQALSSELGVDAVWETGGMLEIVRRAREQAGGHGVVILSPAASSFDMFHDYKDRGEQFIQAVQRLT